MDKNRFDGFTRQLAQRENRRQAIKTLLAGGAGTAAALMIGKETQAAKPPSTSVDCCPASAPRLCGLTCTPVATDPNNCGACGVICGAGQTCVNGLCSPPPAQCKKVADCASSNTECRQATSCTGGVCRYTFTANNTLVANQTAGDCQKNVCDGNGNIVSRDDNTDLPTPSGDCVTATCTNGVPSQPPKTAGVACGTGDVCDGAGTCVACNSAADCSPPANAHAVCNADHTCSYACNSGFGDCTDADGCETNTHTDVNNCGGCGTVCVADHATSVCNSGTCGIGSCDSGFVNCDGNPATGCEINTSSDVDNCGGCGMACSSSNGTASCIAGTCGIMCSPGYENCNGISQDGCETNILSSINNCGSCGRVCQPANGVGVCQNGTCQIASCNSGFGDCDGNPANGCEINFAVDLNNCGSCGNRCTDGRTCSNGTCVIPIV